MKYVSWFCLTFIVAALTAQSVRLIPNLAVAETEYRDAQEAWLKNDPNLEQDLFKAPPVEMRRRIERAAALRDDLMSKKAVYLDFLVKRFDEIKTRLVGLKTGAVPAAQVKTDLQEEQARLLSEQERVETLMGDIPPGDEYTLVRRAMEQEKSDLIQLQNNVAMRIRAVDKMGQTQQPSPQIDSFADRLEELKKIWEEERSHTRHARADWSKYYRDLELSLDDKGAQHAKPVAQLPTKAVDATAISGTWIYSQSGAWTGFGPPLAVLLQIQTVGNRVDGIYSARLPDKDGIRDITLTITGQITSIGRASLKWTSERPVSHGEIDLQLGADGKIWVRRIKSEESNVPLGAEVLSPK